MGPRRRQVWSALGFGVAGAMIVVYGRGLDLEAGPPPAATATWGLVTGSAVGWIVASLPQRATFPLGFGTLLAAVAAFAPIVVFGGLMGQDLLNADPDEFLAVMLVCSGVGWVLGAVIGAALAARGTPLTSGQAWLARGVALAVLPVGAALAWVATLSGRTPEISRAELSVRAVVVADALLVSLTLLAIGWRRQATAPEERRVGSAFTRGTAAVGVALGTLVTIALLGAILVRPQTVEYERRSLANQRTADSLARTVGTHWDRDEYPADLEEVLAAGGRIQPGSAVAAFDAEVDRLCVTVGTDSGDGVEGPYWTLVVRSRSMSVGVDHDGLDCLVP